MGRYKLKKRKDWKAQFRQVGPSLRERNLTLMDTVDDIFDVRNATEWRDVKRNITADRIRQFYKIVAEIWPPDTNLTRLLPRPDNKLKALYLGDVHPESLVRNVFRFGLYTEEIFIIDPFHKPWRMANEWSPTENPNIFKEDTLKLIYFAARIEPWIRAGLVTLIPDPGDFDPELEQRTEELAKKRLLSLGEEEVRSSLKVFTEDMASFSEDTIRYLACFQETEVINLLRKANPKITEQEITDKLTQLKQFGEDDPLALEEAPDQIGNQLLVGRTGVNTEMSLYISEITGAFPYTSLQIKWRDLLRMGGELSATAKVWTPLTKAFQDLEFKFLNNVDSRFACAMRADGRLEDLRVFLRRLWKTIDGSPEADKIDTLARDFRDELTHEYHKAEAEWSKINQDLINWAGGTGVTGLGIMGLAGAVVTGNMLLGLPSLLFIPAGVSKLVDARTKRTQFRKTTPMSVFIDLSKKNL